MNYSDWVKQERVLRGFNIQKLAALVGVHANTISCIEHGKVDPRYETKLKIKKVFDENEPVVPDGVKMPAMV